MTEEGSSSIDDVLDAPDYYAVLGVPETLEDIGALRRAYLSKSVQVHPDKNGDPRATEAFQKVAEAWNVLSDGTARAEYDQQRQRLKGIHDDSESHYTSPPAPSFQDALFAFATATSMMGGSSSSSAMGSMAQTLYWAEKLVQGRPEQGAEKAAHAAMALGSGLRAVAFGAKMMGFKNASAVADRSATLAHTVGVGTFMTNAAAKDNPAVQQALSQGGEKAKGISESIHRSIKGQLERSSVKQAMEKGAQLRKSIVDTNRKKTT